jgi:hypothetical protein
MIDDLIEWLKNKPFVPFRIILTSGTGYDVRSPYQIAVGKTQFDYYFPRSDRKAILRLNKVAAFETLEEAPRRE